MASISKEALLEAISTAQEKFILDNDSHTIFDGLLTRAIELTESKYGLIAEAFDTDTPKPYIKTRAISNIAWNAPIADYYQKNIDSGLIFRELNNLFGRPVLTGKTIISNSDIGNRFPNGHPRMQSFMGIPLFRGNLIVGVVGLANREGGYSDDMVDALAPFLSTCSILIEAFKNHQRRKTAEDEVNRTHRHLEELVQERTAQLEKAKEEAETALKSKSNFLAMISHELRTPLNGVIGLTGLLMSSTNLQEEEKQYLENIRASGEALLYLLNDILDYSKIESSILELEEINFNVRNCVEEVADIMAFQAQDKGVDLITTISHHVPLEVIGDPGRVRQIILNLVSNAVKFTTAGHVSIRVELTEEREKDVIVKFAVEDTGIGIPESAKEKLFRPFSQVHTSQRRTHGGTGLGLAISKQLARLMNGDLTYETKEGKGSTFYLTVPFLRSYTSLSPSFSDTDDLQGKSVLIVTDNPVRQLSIEELMKSLCCKVELISSSTSLVNNISARMDKLDILILFHQDLKLIEREYIHKWADKKSTFKIICLCTIQEIQHSLHDYLGEQDKISFLQTPIKLSSFVRVYKQMMGRRVSGKLSSFASWFENIDTSIPILIADDNATNQMVLQRTLNRLGFTRCDVVSDGKEAYHSLKIMLQRGKPYKLCFMDYYMPVQNGVDAIRSIRKYESDHNIQEPLSIIVMTAGTLLGDRNECFNAGSNDMLGKPVKIEELVVILRKYLAPT